jgi:hypothetical protein
MNTLKNLSLALLLALASTAQAEEKRECDEIIMFQPNGESVNGAAKTFSVELKVFANSCRVQNALKLEKNQHIKITAYAQASQGRVASSETIRYELRDFAANTIQSCELTVSKRMKERNSDIPPTLLREYDVTVTGPRCGKAVSL